MSFPEKKLKQLKALLNELFASLGDEDEGEGNGEDDPEEDDPPPKKPAKKPAAKGKKPPADEDESEDEGGDDELSLNEVRALAVKASKKATDGKEKVLAALQRHGSEKLSEIEEDQYSALAEMLQQIIDDDDFDPRETKKKPAKKAGKKKPADDDDDF